MTKKTRTILFILVVILFLLAAPSLILYSQGYRFDLETKKVVQTGGLYFRILPRGAQVYVNGELKDETSLFTISSLIKNLIPKKYSVEIKKDGYYPWQKTLEVREKQVTEAKNVILFPQNPNFTEVSTSTEEIETIVGNLLVSDLSPDQKKLLEYNDHEIWFSLLGGPPEQSAGPAPERIFLTRFSEKIGRVLWLNDYYLIFNVGEKIKIAEIDDRDKLNVVDLAQFPEPQIFWDQNNRKLYVLSGGKLYVAENLLP